jgi:hypothetical protein
MKSSVEIYANCRSLNVNSKRGFCITRAYILRMMEPSGETLQKVVKSTCNRMLHTKFRQGIQKHNGVLTGYVKLGKNNMCKKYQIQNYSMIPPKLMHFGLRAISV